LLAPDEPPALGGVLETALYVDDMERARDFYERILGLKPLTVDERLTAYAVGERSVLLLFRRGSTLETVQLPGGTIPPHDGTGPAHLAFAVSVEALTGWESRLKTYGIAVEGRTDWPRGGKSLYVRDPDRHLVEFATPGIWAIY
jgi:catechol 2,3-dioxygenase-like lactoylglutathione lyase family enzyme